MKRWMLAFGVLTLAGTSVQADLTRGSQSVAVFGGWGGSSSQYDYQPGHQRSVTGGGGAFGAQYLYYVKDVPAIAIGADLDSSQNGIRRSGDLINNFESSAHVKSFVGTLIARLAYPRGKVRPYVFGGVGVHHSTQQLSAQPTGGTTWSSGGTESRILVDERQTSAALNYGIGLDIFPTECFFIGAELRGAWLAGLDTDDNAALNSAGITVGQKSGITQGNLFLRAGVKF